MTKKYLADPFNALYLYQGDYNISIRPEIQEIDEYARDLEDRIEGDFNLDYITFEFAYNRLAYVRNGLLLAKLKFLKLYKRFGDGTRGQSPLVVEDDDLSIRSAPPSVGNS